MANTEGCSSIGREENLELKVLILLFDDVEVLDFAGPFEVFSVASQLVENGTLEVLTIAQSMDEIKAIGGLRLRAQRTFVDTPTGDIIVLPGGAGSRREMDNPLVLDWLRAARSQANLVMSVCSGARILARAGLLDGLTVTTHHQVVHDLGRLAPLARIDSDRRFIDTGQVLTTGGISAGIDASFYVVSRFLGADLARRTADYMEYDWNPRSLTAYQVTRSGA